MADKKMQALNLNESLILVEVLVFGAAGLFGNINLLWSTARKKSLRSKPGILLAINAASHIVCILGEFVNIGLLISRLIIIRSFCYPIIVPYLFAMNLQAMMALAISVDLIIALLFPIWYRIFHPVPYILIVLVICSSYSLTIIIYGWTTLNDEVIPFCNPPLGLPPIASRVWSVSNVVINCAVVITYMVIITFVHIRGKSRACQEHRRVVRRLKVITIVFVFSWFIAVLGVDLGYAVGFSQEVLNIWQSHMVFFALICYSQTFFVCMWRSHEYRSAFYEQVYLMTCKKPPAITSMSVSTNNYVSKVFKVSTRSVK